MKIQFISIILTIVLVSCKTQKSFVGYSTAKVNSEKVLEINTYGFSDKQNEKSYLESTIQPIGSVSKVFIGISLMIAKEKGLIDLDVDINNYLDFEIVNPRIIGANKITLRHLATHTSGIIDNREIYESSYHEGKEPNQTLEYYLKDVLSRNGEQYSKKSFNNEVAGNRYEYSNIGAALAAYIIEKTSNQSFSSFTENYIFKPLKMNNSGWFYSDINISNHSILYGLKGEKLKPYTCIVYPDGSLKTNINDLSKFLIELIKGNDGRSKLMSKESWKEFYEKNFSESNLVFNIPKKEPNAGIFIAYFNSGKVGHTGSDLGVSCVMMFDPKMNTGQIFMANEDLTKNNLGRFKAIWNELE